MGFLDWFKREKRLIDYSPEELRREEGRLQIRESHAVGRVEKAEAEQEVIFRRGFMIRSSVRRRILARQYEEKEHEIARLEKDLAKLWKEVMTVASIRHRLERRARGESSLLKKVGGREVEGLREAFESDEVDEQEFAEKLAGVLGSLEGDEDDPIQGLSEAARSMLETWEAADAGDEAAGEEETEEAAEPDEA